MSDRELEAVIWCPACRVDKGRAFRVPAANEGVFTHVTEPENLPKQCECGTNLERK